jgi:hypothetical protein
MLSVFLFVVFAGVSMTFYPGGSWLNMNATGHDFFRNFLCDLLGPTAINGQPNSLASVSMKLAMAAMLPGLACLWFFSPTLFPARINLGRAIRACGVLSLLGLAAVPLTPPTASYELHAAAIFSGGIPSVLAWVLTLVGLWFGHRRVALVGLFAFVSVAFGFGLYAREYFFHGAPSILLPASHRVGTGLLLGFMVAVSGAFRGQGESGLGD